MGLSAGFAFARPLSWVLAPAAVAVVYAFNGTFGGNLPFERGAPPAIIFLVVSNPTANVLVIFVICWTVSRIGRAGWRPAEERMERDGSLVPLFAALWQDSLRALGLVLFTSATWIAFAWWLEQWPFALTATSVK